jgi:sugar phosphate isomerase/epimerase
MQLGIFAKTFVRPTLEGVLDAVGTHGFECVQFNMACAGLLPLPERIDDKLCEEIRQAMKARGLTIAAVSGTFNMIHPSEDRLRDDFRRFRVLAHATPRMGASILTLCTGTRDSENMWRRHPENDDSLSWTEMLLSMEEAVEIAEEAGVTLAFEPEVANVVDSARKGRLLLDFIGSPRLKVVMDPANLFHAGELSRQRDVLEEAFALLGRDIVIAHAKDLSRDGEAGHEAAGTGLLDYDCYLRLLRGAGFQGPLILHGLTEAQVPQSLAFLRGKLAGGPH